MKYNIIDFFRKCIFYTPVFRIGARQIVGLLQRAGIVKPKVSIIVAAYNIEVYIDECLRSFTNQYFLNLEIVVVDDGSADGTTNIIKSHMRKDFRVKLFRQKNQGLSLARNNGFAHSKGEFICYVDGDDKMERNAVSDAYNSLAKTGSDFTVSYYVREEGGEIEGAKKVISPPAYWIQYIHQKYRPKTSVEQFPALMQNSTAWGKLFRRSFLIDKDLQFIPGKLYEDQPFIAKAYSLSKNGVDILDKIHYFWRIVGTSISNTTFTYKDIRERIDSAKMSISIYKKYMSENVVQKRLIQYLSHDFLAPLRTLSEVENKTKWLDILREGLLFLMSNLKEENLEKVNPLSRAANELIITRQYDELIDFYKETAFENRAVYVKKVKDKPCMDVVQTFPKAKTVKHLKDLPLVQELIFLIENLYEIDPSQSNENHYTVLGWAFLTCLDPKLFDYYYEFIIDGKKVNYESFDYREVLKHDQSQSINFLSTGFKIKIPKNAKELILKLSAGGFEREKKIEL
ncbi:MAG: glycosyltransferase, partial [Bifidobacteriaceae bacterium]|nr:glycosyltransferase [Bifidobacteriaceae bacterium]